MRYVGGKSKIARQLASVMLDSSSLRGTYLEPFVGGGSVLAQMAPHFNKTYAGDAHEDLILMWQSVFSGWQPPEITYDRYQELRYQTRPSPERGFAGFGGSFGGRWFEGFARGGFNKDTPRNHQEESARAVLRIFDKIKDLQVTFENKDYRDWFPGVEDKCLIYCDPPYAGSLHDYKTGSFDTESFWKNAQGWSERGHDVFVSEYAAPKGWVSVWSGMKRQSLIIGSSKRDIRKENLWVWRG